MSGFQKNTNYFLNIQQNDTVLITHTIKFTSSGCDTLCRKCMHGQSLHCTKYRKTKPVCYISSIVV